MPAAGGITSVSLGHHDVLPPGGVVATSVVSSVFPTSVSLRWTGVLDDTNGTGLFVYVIARNGVFIATDADPEYVDKTVAASTSYSYSIFAYDYHGNTGSTTTFMVTTPPANAVDPRRTGTYTTGSYWGGAGEQIDTLSGNLNFSLPLVTAQGRTGWSVPVGLSYNSQNWRQDGSVNWKLGNDVGYGFGSQMLVGSITPYYASYWSGVDHYVYTDATGAQYLLNVNSGGVWSGTSGVYVWFDSNTDKLHFRDGSFWVMGCTSGGAEADAGTLYPTIVEDVSGNQVILAYAVGAGLPTWPITTNSSSRITSIEDSRAVYDSFNSIWATYEFTYNSDVPVPHLTSVSNLIGTSETYPSFTYSGAVALGPPFGYDPAYAGLTTTQLTAIAVPTANPWRFTYDSAGASELVVALFPWGGQMTWGYSNDPYSGSRNLRAVSTRALGAGSTGGPFWYYGISRDNAAVTGAATHGTMTLSDASGVGAKTWNFIDSTSPYAWQVGLVKEFVQSTIAGGTALQDDLYTWSQDPAGNPFISTKASTIGQGTPNVETATSTQTLDQYGNVTQAVIYPFNNTSTPLQTYTNTYLNSAAYTANYVVNRLASSSLLTGGVTIPLVANTYDSAAFASSSSSPTMLIDPSPPAPATARGNLQVTVTPAVTTTNSYYSWGSVASVNGSDGTNVTASADSATNYAAPMTITAQSYTQSLVYNSWLGTTQTTGANGEILSMNYDTYGRPSTATSPYGAVTTYSYFYGSGAFSQQASGPSGITTTTLDGLGRPILVTRGDSISPRSSTATVYAPIAGAPLGKVTQVSQPYPAALSPSAWTTTTYDGLGRSLSAKLPDNLSTTTYAYAGNQTTVTDPAGKWKTFTSDVMNNLTTVVEPDPANLPLPGR